jgi:UDP-N-acetylmuramate--alanine ligase
VPFYGLSALCLDNPGVQEVLPQLTKRFTTFGSGAGHLPRAQHPPRRAGHPVRRLARADELGEVVLNMWGRTTC